MVRKIILVLLFIYLASATYMTFDQFIAKFNKSYQSGTKEYLDKEAIYKKNIQILKKKNCPVCGVTKFFDVDPKEFESEILTLQLSKDTTSDQFPEDAKRANKVGAPPSVDWRSAGVVTSVKHQGECGSCWAFTSVALAETNLILKGKASRSIDLSQQFLLECTSGSDCGGGFIESGLDVVISKGLPTDDKYQYNPYARHSGICYSLFNKKVSSKPRMSFYSLTVEQIKDLLTMGPVAIALSSTNWEYYAGGIWKCNSWDEVNHAVLLVGYTNDYWIIKNHWGPDWGEDGYIRVSSKPGENCKIGTAVHMLIESNLKSLIGLLGIMLMLINY